MTDSILEHPFLKAQLVYDAQPEIASAPPYTAALWDQQHRWISADIARWKPVEKARLLDLGCGPGHIADSQSDHIGLYLGVDPSMIELRRVEQAPNRLIVHGIGEQLDFLAPASIDVAIMVSVLDHCIDWRLALERCVAALRPGGLLLIAMENSEQLPSRIRRGLGREVEHHGHMDFISLTDLATALDDRFETLKARTFGYGFGLHSLTRKLPLPRAMFDALIPAMNWIGRLLMPDAGQVLYGCYRKYGSQSAQISQVLMSRPLPLTGGIYDGFGEESAPHHQ